MIEPTDEMAEAVEAVDGLDYVHPDLARRIVAAVLAIVEKDYEVLPRFIGPSNHAFQRHGDPSFGSVFGGGCAAEVGNTICGWPEQAHRWRQP